MGLNLFSNISNIISQMNNNSSIFSTIDISNLLLAFNLNMDKIVQSIFSFFASLFYLIAKWFLLVVDILFSYVQELCGLNTNFSSLESLFAPESDIILNLLISGKSVIIPIVRALAGLAIILIIIFSIIGIIKTQLSSLSEKGANYGNIVKGALKGLLFLVLTPMISVVGIVASNLLLQTFYNATNLNGYSSLGAHIFGVSSTSANAYRNYAQNGSKIPIMFDFSQEKTIYKYFVDNEPNSQYGKDVIDSKSPIYGAYMMFLNNQYYNYNNVNLDEYYLAFDKKPLDEENKNIGYQNTGLNKFMKIEGNKEEYYVMADVVDYCMATSASVYFKTIEEVLDSIVKLQEYGISANDRFIDFIETYQIKLLNHEGLQIDLNNLDDTNITILDFYSNKNNWSAISYESEYVNEMGDSKKYNYTHIKGAKDEIDGAKYLISIEKDVFLDGYEYSYYYPFTKGEFDKDYLEFKSEYIEKAQIISGKGIFFQSKFPTAIKTDSAGTVHFYRDNINTVAEGQVDKLMSLSFKEEDQDAFDKIKKFFQKLFNPQKLIPVLKIDPNAVTQGYSSNIADIDIIQSGKFHIGYMMNSSKSSVINSVENIVGASNYGLNIYEIYDITKLNFLILLMATFLLIGVCFKATFILIERAYNLMMIIIFYPTACATMPLTDAGYKKWMSSYMSNLLATYGMILGINFVLMLFPIINTIEFFTPVDLQNNPIITRVGGLFFDVMSINQITRMMNMVVALLFELVALSLLREADTMIGALVGSTQKFGGYEQTKQYIVTAVKTTSEVGALIASGGQFAVAKVGNMVKAIKDPKEFIRKKVDKLKGHLPGSALIEDQKDKKYMKKKKQEMNDAKRELQEAMRGASDDLKLGNEDNKDDNDAAVQDALEKFKKAQEAYTKAVENPTGTRKAEEEKEREQREEEKDKKKKEERDNAKSRDDEFEDSEEYSDMTKKQLKRKKKKAQKEKKQLEKRIKKQEKKGQDTKAEMELLEKQEQIINDTLNEIKTIKQEKKTHTYGERKARIKARKQEIKEDDKARREEERNQEELRKQNEKMREKDLEDRRTFSGHNAAKRAIVMKTMEGTMKNDLKKLQGLKSLQGIDFENVDDEQLKEMLNDSSIDINDRKVINTYLNNKKRFDSMVEYDTNRRGAASRHSAAKRVAKDTDTMGYNGFHIIRKGKRRHQQRKYDNVDIESIDSEITEIDAQLAELEKKGINPGNYKEKQAYLERKNALIKQKTEKEQWDENSEKGNDGMKAERKGRNKSNSEYNKKVKKAIELIENRGIVIYKTDKNGKKIRTVSHNIFDQASINAAIQYLENEKNNKKKKKK